MSAASHGRRHQVLPYMGSGPDWYSYQGMHVAQDGSCNQNWVYNLLYLNMVRETAIRYAS